MVTADQAEHLVNGYLSELQDRIGLPLQVVGRVDVSVGWVFFYNSKSYAESGDIGSMLAGNAPILIDSTDGSLHVLGTAHPLETYLQEYARSRAKS